MESLHFVGEESDGRELHRHGFHVVKSWVVRITWDSLHQAVGCMAPGCVDARYAAEVMRLATSVGMGRLLLGKSRLLHGTVRQLLVAPDHL
jgi:hypothetical protein